MDMSKLLVLAWDFGWKVNSLWLKGWLKDLLRLLSSAARLNCLDYALSLLNICSFILERGNIHVGLW